MTFNLAARQKPKDISPNRITACSSPSSHNFQLDPLTAARSAASQPATSSAAHQLERTCPGAQEEALRRLFACIF